MFVADTSALYALLDADDANHRRAAEAWEQLVKSGRTMILHDFVLLECVTLVQGRLGMDAVEVFHRDFMPLLERRSISPEIIARGIARCLGARRRDLSLTDCVTFELAREANIIRAFAFDRHFREAGFLVPGDPRFI
jgi:predicted nucleic acid-binding protein